MLTVYNQLGLQEVLLCEGENILSIESKSSPIETLIFNLFLFLYNRGGLGSEFFCIKFIYAVKEMRVSIPIEILWAILDFIGDYELLSDIFPCYADSEGVRKSISDNEMGEIKAKQEKISKYIDMIIKEYIQTIIDYRQTNEPQNYFTVSKITEIINTIKQL